MKAQKSVAAFAIAALLGPGLIVRMYADVFGDWQWRNPIPQGQHLNAVVHANGLTVAVGNSGTIVTSPDRTNWISQRIGFADLVSIAHGNGRFVALSGTDPFPPTVLGLPSSGNAYTSSNGVNWSQTLTSPGNGRVAYGNDRFVALTADSFGQISPFVSTNGVNWTAGTKTNVNSVLRGLAFGNGRFVAIAAGSVGGTSLVSTDGTNWSRTTFTNRLIDIHFEGGLFYGAGVSGVFQSVDGVTWIGTSDNVSGPSSLTAIASGGNRFVAQGSQLPPSQFGDLLEMSSSDGIHWETNQPSAGGLTRDICWTGDKFVAVGNAGRISTSSDGITWAHVSSLPTSNLRDLAYGQETLVVVGGTPPGSFRWLSGRTIFASSDGIHRSVRVSTNAGMLNSIAFGNGLFVAVGNGGMTLKSADSFAWEEQNCGSSNSLRSIAFNGGQFIAAGLNGTIVASPDGTHWSAKNSGSTAHLFDITCAGGLWVVVGADGFIATSPDGETWTQRSAGVTDSLNSVAYGNGTFVAMGNTRVWSVNGVDWFANPFTGSWATQMGVVYVHGVFLSIGVAGVGFTSPNGINRTDRAVPPLPFPNGFYGLLNVKETVVLVGDNGSIVQSAYFGPPILLGTKRTNGFHLTIAAETGRPYRLQASTNFVQWTNLTSYNNSQVTNTFLDATANQSPLRFYRVVSP